MRVFQLPPPSPVQKADPFPVVSLQKDEEDAASFVANDPYAKAGLFQSSFVTQLAELDVTGQHLDRQWEKFQLEGKGVFYGVCVCMYTYICDVRIDSPSLNMIGTLSV